MSSATRKLQILAEALDEDDTKFNAWSIDFITNINGSLLSGALNEEDLTDLQEEKINDLYERYIGEE